MKRLLSKRGIAAFCLVLLLLFLLRPGAGWMRARVTNSISQALGRSVQIGSVRLRFLPRPGFEIDDLLVRDDPAYGAEPLVRAAEVKAALSLGALLRGKIEIARLSLSGPSLNLTRNGNGTWNLEDLIDRTSHTSLAPTGSPTPRAGPRFPYIEANDARLNFKLGTEKTHFALTNAEFALWQESANTWGIRLQGRPIRTDANLTDTGVVNVNALWRRSAQVHQTPIQITYLWKQAQIGQVSKLAYGTDKDWRGAALLSGSIQGTPARLRVVADATVDDFRREDVIGGSNLRMGAHCTAEYVPLTRELANIDCTGPIGNGYVQVKGGVSGLLAGGGFFAKSDLWLVASHVPAESLVNTFRHAGPEFPAELEMSGDVSSNIQFLRRDEGQPIAIEGKGLIDKLEIARNGGDAIGFGSVPFNVSNGTSDASPKNDARKDVRKRNSAEARLPQAQELRIEFGPVNLAPGKAGPLTVQATVTRTGFTGSEHGDASIARLLLTAKSLGIPAPGFSGEGMASVNLHASGTWFSGNRPLVTGTARLRSVHAQVRGLNAAIAIQNADLTIDANAVRVQNLSATTGDASWHGSFRIPRPCAKPGDCALEFDLHGDKLSAATLNKLLNPAQRPKTWYRFLSLGKEQPSYLLQARASGTLALDRLTLGSSSCAHITSDVTLEAGTLTLADFKAECLKGIATGSWKANFTVSPPEFSGAGLFEDVSLETVADLTNDGWVEGAVSAKYEFKTSGSNMREVLDAASVDAQFRISGGKFTHIVLTRESGPLRTSHFSGNARLTARTISFHEAKLTSGSEVYTVSGTASLAGALNMKALTENAGGYNIGGTFVKTRVSAIPNAEASLKP